MSVAYAHIHTYATRETGGDIPGTCQRARIGRDTRADAHPDTHTCTGSQGCRLTEGRLKDMSALMCDVVWCGVIGSLCRCLQMCWPQSVRRSSLHRVLLPSCLGRTKDTRWLYRYVCTCTHTRTPHACLDCCGAHICDLRGCLPCLCARRVMSLSTWLRFYRHVLGYPRSTLAKRIDRTACMTPRKSAERVVFGFVGAWLMLKYERTRM